MAHAAEGTSTAVHVGVGIGVGIGVGVGAALGALGLASAESPSARLAMAAVTAAALGPLVAMDDGIRKRWPTRAFGLVLALLAVVAFATDSLAPLTRGAILTSPAVVIAWLAGRSLARTTLGDLGLAAATAFAAGLWIAPLALAAWAHGRALDASGAAALNNGITWCPLTFVPSATAQLDVLKLDPLYRIAAFTQSAPYRLPGLIGGTAMLAATTGVPLLAIVLATRCAERVRTASPAASTHAVKPRNASPTGRTGPRIG